MAIGSEISGREEQLHDPELWQQAQGLLEEMSTLNAIELSQRMIDIGLYSEDRYAQEMHRANDGIPADGHCTFEEYVDSCREFYVELLIYLATQKAHTVQEVWNLHNQARTAYTEKVMDLMKERDRRLF